MTGQKLARKFTGNSALRGVSHIILDEVHLRDIGTDLVMVSQNGWYFYLSILIHVEYTIYKYSFLLDFVEAGSSRGQGREPQSYHYERNC